MNCKNCLNKIEKWMKYCPYCGYCLEETFQRKNWTLNEIYSHWKKFHFRRIKPKTIQGIEYAWTKLSPLAHKRFVDIQVDEYQQIIDNNATSYSRQHQIRNLISLLCNYAIKYQIMTINWGSFLILDAPKGKPKNIFKDEEIAKIAKYAESNTLQYTIDAKIVMCLIYTGMRPDEFFSLKKKSINIKERYIIGGGKTAAGTNRFIPIPSAVFSFIEEWYSSTKSEDDFLVRSETESKIELSNWRKRNFYPLLSFLKINPPYIYKQTPYYPTYVPYSCRHTFASLSARAKMDRDILSKIIGHTDPSFTQKVYIHQQIPEYREEIQKLENLISSFSL